MSQEYKNKRIIEALVYFVPLDQLPLNKAVIPYIYIYIYIYVYIYIYNKWCGLYIKKLSGIYIKKWSGL